MSDWQAAGPEDSKDPKKAAASVNRPLAPAGAPVRRHVNETDLAASLKWPVRTGLAVVFLFFGVLTAWAAVAPLAGGAYAPGVISPDGSRKTVQHLEGGIVAEILVKDGDKVAVGDHLVLLEGTQARASHQLLLKQRRELLAIRARLTAEQIGAETIDFPPELLEHTDDTQVLALVQGQTRLFESRREANTSQRQVLDQRVGQLEAQIEGLEEQIASQTRQIGLIEDELTGVQDLVDRGLERRPRLLALQRDREAIAEARSRNIAEIARAEQAIGETNLRILNLQDEFLDEVTGEMERVRGELATLEERIVATGDVVRRTTIISPVDGTVVNLRVKTTGGVIAPGEPILDIVPSDDDLIVDARVSLVDIDVVRAGLEAQVMLTAFSQRNLPRVTGTVVSVSADSLTDERTGEPYFSARVEINREELEALTAGQDIELAPGMPADVLIVTVQRTTLDYLLAPFLQSLGRAFREA